MGGEGSAAVSRLVFGSDVLCRTCEGAGRIETADDAYWDDRGTTRPCPECHGRKVLPIHLADRQLTWAAAVEWRAHVQH